MASAPKAKKTTTEEKTVDYMKDAPKERPYEEAMSDEHKEFLAAKKEARHKK